MATETRRSGGPGPGPRPRWQMTSLSRFALVLGLAGLAVAGVQLAMLSDPPTVVQLVVVAFWSVVGTAYLGSAAAQRLRARRRPAPAPTPSAPPGPVEEILPVSIRPAVLRPRLAGGADGSATGSGAPVGEGHGAHDREAPLPVERAARVGVGGASVGEGHVAHDREASRPAERAARVGRLEVVKPTRVAIRARRRQRSADPVPVAAVPDAEDTTDAFTVRAASTVTRADENMPTSAMLVGLPSALSFGPSLDAAPAEPATSAMPAPLAATASVPARRPAPAGPVPTPRPAPTAPAPAPDPDTVAVAIFRPAPTELVPSIRPQSLVAVAARSTAGTDLRPASRTQSSGPSSAHRTPPVSGPLAATVTGGRPAGRAAGRHAATGVTTGGTVTSVTSATPATPATTATTPHTTTGAVPEPRRSRRTERQPEAPRHRADVEDLVAVRRGRHTSIPGRHASGPPAVTVAIHSAYGEARAGR